MTAIHRRAVKERIHITHPGLQISGEALALMDRLIDAAVDSAATETITQGRLRITAGIMRRALENAK